jgi:hypothetical protein
MGKLIIGRAAGTVAGSKVPRGSLPGSSRGWFMGAAWMLMGAVAGNRALCEAQDVSPQAQIIVGPNVQVSQDGEFPHVEVMVAGNPVRAGNLLGAAITVGAGGKLGVTQTSKTYASLDGGNTWIDAIFREQQQHGGGDPVIAFGRSGTAYLAVLDYAPAGGRRRTWLRVYRSEDGGLAWGRPATLGYSYDRPKIAVDRGEGVHSGRVYITATYRRNGVSKVGLFYSDDDARTFSGPVEVVSGHGGWDVQATEVLVFSDGVLFVSYVEYQRPAVTGPDMKLGATVQPMKVVLSSDGGRSFGGPYQIEAQAVDSGTLWSRTGKQGPAFAIDGSRGPFRDHIYVAWMDTRFGRSRILLSRSADRGMSWSKPMLVDPGAPSWTVQYNQTIAVNGAGVVGVAWLDTRASRSIALYDEYFSASTDGGRHFLPAVRVSRESSVPEGSGNLTPVVQSWRGAGADSVIVLAIAPATVGFPNGGDYMGLAADARGVFHPFWVDSRSGTFQVYTASVRVQGGSGGRQRGSGNGPSPIEGGRVRDITRLVEIVGDRGRIDFARHLLTVGLRLRNISDTTIYGPVRLRLLGPYTDYHRDFAPVIVGGGNEEEPGKAEIDFTGTLERSGALLPGAVSDAVEVRLQFTDPLRIPLLKACVTGLIDHY